MTDQPTDVAERPTDLVPAGDAHFAVTGAEVVQATPRVHAHPGPRQYVLVAVVLAVITAAEVAASYLDGDMNSNLLIALLGIMAAMKFFLVAAWFMHMKVDQPFFRRIFVVGMIGAGVVYSVAMVTFASTVLKL